MSDAPASIDEKYGRAIGSSHLAVRPEALGDVDFIIAAGFVAEGLGTALFRLRSEWDVVRADHHRAQHQHASANDTMRQHRRAAVALPTTDCPDERFARWERQAKADWQIEQANRAALTARALILVRLKTLAGARQALWNFALGLAARSNFSRPYREVAAISGRALEAWLDPTCPVCNGTGHTTEPGLPMALCTACKGTRRRRVVFSHHPAGMAFGQHLVARMESKCDHVASQMNRALSQHQRPAQAPPAQAQALQTKLRGLRSDEAQED